MSLVERVDTRVVELALPKPVGTAIHQMHSVGCVIVELHTADGAIGTSFIFGLNNERVTSLDEMVKGLARFVEGRPVDRIEGAWHDMWSAVNAMGHKGVTVSAMSALDVALWDAWAITLNTPLHRLWGSCRDHVDTYASSGLWLSYTIDELVAEAAAFIDQGFTAMKIRLGSQRAADDVARVRAVRQAIGDDVALLSDVNQGLSPKAAIRLGRALEEFELTWFEEPVAAYDLAGHAMVRQALDVPIASGETEYTRHGMQAMLTAGAVDVLMPDLQRIGGFSEFRKSSALAAGWNTPVSSHFFTEHSLCLAGSLQNCISVEHCDWFAPLFNESMTISNGKIAVPDRPGHGFTISDRWR